MQVVSYFYSLSENLSIMDLQHCKFYYHLLEDDFASKIRPSMIILHEKNVRMQDPRNFVTIVDIWLN
jgi:hypothetical protein